MVRIVACSLDAGAADPTDGNANVALGVFAIGVFLLIFHAAFFVYGWQMKYPRSGLVFWSTLVLSALSLPIVFFLIVVSAGTACGIGASYPPMFLLVFELAALVLQVVSSRPSNQPTVFRLD